MRFLIVRACAIGDFVLHLPALRALAAAHPEAQFTLVGYPAILSLARTFLPVQEIVSVESQPWSGLFSAPVPGIRYDAAWVWMKDSAVAENLRRSGVPEVFHRSPFPSAGQHAAEHLLKTVALPAPGLPDLWNAGSSRIVMHPGSGSPAKVWPHFEELARLMPESVILLGPCETPLRTANACLRNLSLPEVAEQLCRSRLFIGNDSGITHIAAYWGTPTAALFGPTDPAVWGPVGRRVKVLRKSSLKDVSIEDVMSLL
jgi:ADP-heptose:LPS heptosyltransferase